MTPKLAHGIPNVQDQQAGIRRFIPNRTAVPERNREGGFCHLERRLRGDAGTIRRVNGVGPVGGSGGTES